MDELYILIRFLNAALVTMQIKVQRSRLDFFADRLVKACSEPTLMLMSEQLLESIDADLSQLHGYSDIVLSMARIASSENAPRVLRWLREEPKIATMLAATDDKELLSEVLASIELPQAGMSGSAATRRAFNVDIRAKCESPLAHGSDNKAGNATLFRRIDVIATNGAHMVLPYYSGNAVRGQMRDLLADHFLSALGLNTGRGKPAVALWFFYALYSGGALEEKSDATKAIKKQLGDNGSIRADGIRLFRDNLPSLSLLGCALGNRILPGRVQFADLRPVCIEWGTGNTPVAELLTWEFLTRHEDHEAHIEHHGMIATTEVLRSGVELEGGIDMDSCMPEIERSALGCGLGLLVKRGMLGADNRRGFGRVTLDIKNVPDASLYEEWLVANKDKIIEYLKQIEALPKQASLL